MINYRCATCGDEVMLPESISSQEYRCPSCLTTGQIGAAPQTPPEQNPYQQPVVPPAYQQQSFSQYSQPVYAQEACAPPLDRENAPGAIGSLVCGILSLFCCGIIFGVIAIALSGQARNAIAFNPGYYGGQAMATAGRVLGIIGLVFGAVQVLAIIFGQALNA